MVAVAQFGRALDCESSGCGFEPHRSPQVFGLVAQLVERLPEEQSVAGSNPAEFTN